jgi:tellurite resistance protein
MEAIITIILIWIGWSIVAYLIRVLGAAGKAAVGKGNFSDNMNLSLHGMQPFEVRFKDSHLEDDAEGPLVKEIEGRGLFPLRTSVRVGFITSVFDATSEKWEPVISMLEAFQEPNTIAYQSSVEVGIVSPNQGLVSFVRIGVVFPDMIQPPYGGNRKIVALIRMVDVDNPPAIEHGFHQTDDPGILWSGVLEFNYDFVEKGYAEAAEHRDEARGLAVKIGLAVAMADGSLDKAEGKTLQDWVRRSIEIYEPDRQEQLKQLYNQAMRDAYTEAKAGDLSLSALTSRLNEIGEMKLKYDAIELCFDVMAADGVADAGEMKVIRQVSDALGLDLNEIEKLRDQKIVGLNSSVSDHASIEDLLGIDPSWDVDLIKKHLRTEFQKWNNRLNTLPEGDERDNAQRMLDVISEARQKYG